MYFRSTTGLKHYLYFLMAGCLMVSCSSRPDANTIINKAIVKAGGQKFDHSIISFTFRGTRYRVERQGGQFSYQRAFTDSTGKKIVDRLTNTGFIRTEDGRREKLSAADSKAYSNALNSVVYFGLLPYKLNDGAVHRKYLGKSTIKGEPYYVIRVTFDQRGGGTDYEDPFVYWIQSNDYTLDYMAYYFHVNGGGTRFRQAKNERIIKGIRFVDYINFKGLATSDSLLNYETLFKQDKTEKVSEINLKNIEVTVSDSALGSGAN